MTCYNADIARLRSIIYHGFSRLVDYPYDDDVPKLPLLAHDVVILVEELVGNLEDMPARAKLTYIIEQLKQAKKAFNDDLNKLGRDMFQAEYVSLFELGAPAPPCPLREIAFKGGEESLEIKHLTPNTIATAPGLILLASLEELYESEGLESRKYPPDHLVVELEYMHYLTTKEYKLLKEGRLRDATTTIEKEKNFLKTHLDWVNELHKCVEGKSKLTFYKHVIRALRAWLDADKEILKHAAERS